MEVMITKPDKNKARLKRHLRVRKKFKERHFVQD